MLCNVLTTSDLDFITPLSKVAQNMENASKIDAVNSGKFWWKMPKDEYKDLSRLSDLEETDFLQSNASNFGKHVEMHNHGDDQVMHTCDLFHYYFSLCSFMLSSDFSNPRVFISSTASSASSR